MITLEHLDKMMALKESNRIYKYLTHYNKTDPLIFNLKQFYISILNGNIDAFFILKDGGVCGLLCSYIAWNDNNLPYIDIPVVSGIGVCDLSGLVKAAEGTIFDYYVSKGEYPYYWQANGRLGWSKVLRENGFNMSSVVYYKEIKR